MVSSGGGIRPLAAGFFMSEISSFDLQVIQERLARNATRGPAARKANMEPLEQLPSEELARGVVKERDLHEDILAFCRGRGWIALHSSMAEATHRNLGEWDFVIIADAKIMRCARCDTLYANDKDRTESPCCQSQLNREGRVFLIECKTAKGKLTPEQAGMKAWAEKLGHKPEVVRSFEEFLEIVK